MQDICPFLQVSYISVVEHPNYSCTCTMQKVIGSTPVGRTRIFFFQDSIPLSLTEKYIYNNYLPGISRAKKKVPSGCPGQVDSPVGQVTFHSHLPNGQGPRQVICQLNRKKSNPRARATCPKGKLEFKFFFKP